MSSTFSGFSLGMVQLHAMLNRRQKVGASWAAQLLPQMRAFGEQVEEHRGMIFNDLHWEWAYFDAYGKLLLGKVETKLQADCYLTEFTHVELIQIQQKTLAVEIVRPIGTGLVSEEVLRRMKGPGIPPAS